MKKIVSLLIIIVLTTLLSGCWSKKELTDISIVSAIGIDKVDNEYLVTIQIINPSEIAGQRLTSRVAVSSYRTTGKTIFEALRRLTLEIPRKAYLSHMRLLIFGEDLAKEGIDKSLDFFSRDHEVRTDFYIMVAKDAMATDVLNILTPLEKIPANKIYSSLEMAEKAWAPVKTIQLDELIACLVCRGREPILTGINLKGDPDIGNDLNNVEHIDAPTTVHINHIAAFKEGKLVGWLDESESRGYNAIMGNITNSVITLPCNKGGKMAIEVVKTDSKVKGRVENGEPKIDIDFKIEAHVGEVQCDIDLKNIDTIEEIEKTLEEKSREFMKVSINKAQNELKSDIFGFGEVIYREDPEAWKELKENWNEEFENLQVNIKVKAKIRRLGTITGTFVNTINEGGISGGK